MHETAEENAAREGVVRFSEVADVVVSEVVDRTSDPASAHCLSVGSPPRRARHNAAKRLEVVGAVERDSITIPGGLLPIDSFRCAWNRSLLVSAQHDGLETTLLDRVFQLLKGFVRRLTRENRYGRKFFRIRREHVGRHHVVGAD